MNLGINGAELIVLILLAVLVLGPEKLPEYTRKLTGFIRNLRQMAEGAKTQFKDETGTDFDEIDWKKYDPRQYDPRRIIREALAEPVDSGAQGATAASVSGHGATSTASSATPSRPTDGLRGELEAARGERDALRQDLKDLDPRSVLFGTSSRRRAAGATAAIETDTAEADTVEPTPAEPTAAEADTVEPSPAGLTPEPPTRPVDGAEPVAADAPEARPEDGLRGSADGQDLEAGRAPFDVEAT